MGKRITLFVACTGTGTFQIIQMSAMFVIMTINTEVFPVASVRRIVLVIVIFMVNRQFMHIPICELSAATGAHPGVNLERLFAVSCFFPALIATGTGQKGLHFLSFALFSLPFIVSKVTSHDFPLILSLEQKIK